MTAWSTLIKIWMERYCSQACDCLRCCRNEIHQTIKKKTETKRRRQQDGRRPRQSNPNWWTDKKKHDYRHEAERMIGVSFCTFEKGRNARNCGFVDEDWSPVDESFSAGAASNSLRRYPSAKLGKKKIFWERKKKQQLGNVETCFLLLLFFSEENPTEPLRLGTNLGGNSVKTR